MQSQCREVEGHQCCQNSRHRVQKNEVAKVEIHGFSRFPDQQGFLQSHRGTQDVLCHPQASLTVSMLGSKGQFRHLVVVSICAISRPILQHDDRYTTEHARRAVSAHPS